VSASGSTLPAWFDAWLDGDRSPASNVRLLLAFLAAPAHERDALKELWRPDLLPGPWFDGRRLGCTNLGPCTVPERVDAAFASLALSWRHGGDERDDLVALAFTFHGALLAGLDPAAVMRRVGAAVGGVAQVAFERFLAREPSLRSMAAFCLAARFDGAAGGYVLELLP
jgi:hypothetical protein